MEEIKGILNTIRNKVKEDFPEGTWEYYSWIEVLNRLEKRIAERLKENV